MWVVRRVVCSPQLQRVVQQRLSRGDSLTIYCHYFNNYDCAAKPTLTFRWNSGSAAAPAPSLFEVERSTRPEKEEVFLSGYETIQQLKE